MPAAIENPVYCSSTTSRGGPCRRLAHDETGLCSQHRRQREARPQVTTPERAKTRWDLTSAAGRLTALEEVAAEVRNGTLDPQSAQALIAAIRQATRQGSTGGRTVRPRVTFAVATTREQAEAINAQREEREAAS